MKPRTSTPLYVRLMFAMPFLVSSTPPSAQTLAPATPTEAPTPAPLAAPAKTYRAGVVKIGEEMKETLGRVTDLDKADNGCFLILRNDKNGELIELGKMEFCTQKPSLKGKNVELEYRLETIQASTCYGDPKCKKTETLPYVVSVKVLE